MCCFASLHLPSGKTPGDARKREERLGYLGWKNLTGSFPVIGGGDTNGDTRAAHMMKGKKNWVFVIPDIKGLTLATDHVPWKKREEAVVSRQQQLCWRDPFRAQRRQDRPGGEDAEIHRP